MLFQLVASSERQELATANPYYRSFLWLLEVEQRFKEVVQALWRATGNGCQELEKTLPVDRLGKLASHSIYLVSFRISIAYRSLTL